MAEDNLYINGFPGEFGEAEVREIFGVYGTITSCRVLECRPGQPGAALVRFAVPTEAQWLVENMNGNIAQGLSDPINVRFANPPNAKGAGQDKGFGKGASKGFAPAFSSPYGGAGGGGGKVCTYFEKYGNCTRGDACGFAHVAAGGFAPGGGGKGGFPTAGGNAGGGAKICTYFEKYGNCTRGDACGFAHVAAGFAPPPAFGGGGGKGGWPPAGGKGGGQGVCTFFQKYGNCTRGDACGFQHVAAGGGGGGAWKGKGGVHGIMLPGTGGGGGAKICTYFAKFGDCTKGDACTFAHVASDGGGALTSAGFPLNDGYKAKTQLCKFFVEKGECNRGANCTFAHGDHELAA